jgi:hypothetical protein
MRVVNTPVGNFIAGDMSGDLISPSYSLNQMLVWSAQFVITGSPVGVLKVQISNYPGTDTGGAPPLVPSAWWTDVANSATAISGAGDVSYNYGVFAGYNWLRFVYTATSGSGSVDSHLNMKGG